MVGWGDSGRGGISPIKMAQNTLIGYGYYFNSYFNMDAVIII